jgi:cysteinyl-tRNA synthetase
MSLDALGESFDIHGGGPDLKFPHHENEIAQSECASGKHFANNWMHAGALRLNSEKMSKSLGNFFSIRDVLGEVHPEVLRYFLLSSHYRSPIDYSSDALVQARRGLDRLYQSLRDLDAATADSGAATISDGVFEKAIAGFEADYLAAMNDDFNTSGAIAALFAVARELNSSLRDALTDSAALGACLRQLGARLGLLELDPKIYFSWQPAGASGLSDEVVADMIDARKRAKSDGDYARSDAIRAELLNQGVELNDTREGVTWKRV